MIVPTANFCLCPSCVQDNSEEVCARFENQHKVLLCHLVTIILAKHSKT